MVLAVEGGPGRSVYQHGGEVSRKDVLSPPIPSCPSSQMDREEGQSLLELLSFSKFMNGYIGNLDFQILRDHGEKTHPCL